MKFYLTIEDEDQVVFETTAPTFEMIEEKVGAWERAKKRTVGNAVGGTFTSDGVVAGDNHYA